MEDWEDNTYDQLLTKCAELVEEDETIKEIFNKLLNEDAIDNITVDPNKTVQSTKMDITWVKENIYHLTKLISRTEAYIDEMKSQLRKLQFVASTCKEQQDSYFSYIAKAKGKGKIHGVVHGVDVVAKGANTIAYNRNNGYYILQEENYRRLDIVLNRMGGNLGNLIQEAEESSSIMIEIYFDALISTL